MQITREPASKLQKRSVRVADIVKAEMSDARTERLQPSATACSPGAFSTRMLR